MTFKKFFKLTNDSESSNHLVELKSNKWSGLFAILAACFLSGFSGIYMEKIFKDTSVTIWMRNSQMCNKFYFIKKKIKNN